MNKVLDRYFSVIKNLRACASHMQDISLIDHAISSISDETDDITDEHYDLISDIINKYNSTLYEYIHLHSPREIVRSRDIAHDLYDKKSTDDVIDDLNLLKDVVLIDAAVHVGLVQNVAYAVREINLLESNYK